MPSHSQKSDTYRPEVDGLRAISVGAVLLYHAQLKTPGGFAGVDVFFVISGFLITSIILKDTASSGGFSILRFWERRIRRILPALLAVIVSTVLIGWFVLLPSDFSGLGKSVMAQAVFGGNFYFWLSSGYFTQPAALKPLLHTWSLAVEEQYYLLFPLLFIARANWKMGALRRGLGIAAVASLGLSYYLSRVAPDAGFYLVPGRAWELLAGALLAIAPRKPNMPMVLSEILGWGGLLAILLAFLFFDERTPFPGIAALLPCAGTVAVIWASDLDEASSSVKHLLALRPLVFLGQISYSLYLWHWPILVYACYWADNGHLRWPARVGLLGASVALAIASWRFVETPIRTRRALPTPRAAFAFGLMSPVVCSLIGVLLVTNDGMPSRFSDAILRCDAARSDTSAESGFLTVSLESVRRGGFPREGPAQAPVRCLVWGDSQAMAAAPALDELAGKFSSSVEFATHPATPPILDFQSHASTSLGLDSKPWSEAVVAHVRTNRISNVLLVASWLWYAEAPSPELAVENRRALAAKLGATTLALRQAGARVWIMKAVPSQPVSVPLGLAKALLKGQPIDVGVRKEDFLKLSGLENEILVGAAENGAAILDPSPAFFGDLETCKVESSGYPLYSDANHVSRRGALLLMDLLAVIWENAQAVPRK
jgi:peptidoglycan/LPS O-acetylase OafA/YrhL